MSKTTKNLVSAIKAAGERKTGAYDTQATVTRIEEGTAWVHIPGGVDETPCKLTINAQAGDTVQVRVGGGRAFLTGNATVPPTGDAEALLAKARADAARIYAAKAQEAADVASTTAAGAQETAVDAQTTANAILVYDHSYAVVSGVAYFVAHLYRGGLDIHQQYPATCFTWYLKTENGEEYLDSGYTMEVELARCGYGAEVIGRFTVTDDSEALTNEGDTLTTSESENLTVRASGDQIRVCDLEVRTTIYDNEKLMVAGASEEHLVTMSSLYDYMLSRLESDQIVIYAGTATELVG